MSKNRKRGLQCWQRLKQKILRYSLYSFAFFCGITLLFRVVPIPFSAYMVQQKVGHLLQGEKYTLDYQWVSIDNIAWQMQLAIIAAEDQKFAQHHGIDWEAIEKALKHNQNARHIRGGSTISQQTVKNLYLWHGQSWLRKGIELPTTLMVELLWTKKRILEVYLNIAEFGEGIFGVEAASRYYFKKSAKQLSQQEAALLAAVLPNPILFKVSKPSAFVQRKQRWIMRQMNLLGKSYLNQLN
ncbi:monofunctional biosynthetic peptidoglycan transglycosylase [Avibacterium paragallinarum]|uniref:monofunctional biosynthetic peptidoglycan transglycosylase n=1 Tax=Avibacterium paragallinarum TaxID=728 RepID=UPI0039884AAD